MIRNGLIDTYKTANMFLLTPVILRYNMVSNNIVPLQTSSLFNSAGVSISPGYKQGRIQGGGPPRGRAGPPQNTFSWVIPGVKTPAPRLNVGWRGFGPPPYEISGSALGYK